MVKKKTVNHRNSNKLGNTQHYNPKTGHWVERDPKTHRFVDSKANKNSPFKKVSK